MAYWGNDPTWQNLNGPQRAAAMALLEADVGKNGINANDAQNALGAIINRSEKENQPLDEHVSRTIYQPIIEDSQRQRLNQIVNSPEFGVLSRVAADRVAGKIPDWVNGADHYLAPPNTMLALEAKEPNKYKSWREWTGYDPNTGQYKNVVLSDNSHQFLNLYGDKGTFNPSNSANSPTNVASATPPPTPKQDNSAMFPFLAQLLGLGGTTAPAALAAGSEAAAPAVADAAGASSAAAAATPVAAAENPLLSSMLPNQFPGGQYLPPGVDQNLMLAQLARQKAAGGASPLQPLQRHQIDLSKLQALMQQKPMLGYGTMGA